jgi:hypothetical protein
VHRLKYYKYCIVILTATLLTGCGFFSNPNWYIQTTDVSKAQEKTPFHIILPSYLPSDIDDTPNILVRAVQWEDRIEVTITYLRATTPGIVEIGQTNKIYATADPSLNPQITVLNIGESLVQAYQTVMVIQHETVSGYHFNWGNRGIDFSVGVFGYDLSEGKKIVASLINQ